MNSASNIDILPFESRRVSGRTRGGREIFPPAAVRLRYGDCVPTIPLPDSVSAQTGVVALSAAKASSSANTMRLVITSPPIVIGTHV